MGVQDGKLAPRTLGNVRNAYRVNTHYLAFLFYNIYRQSFLRSWQHLYKYPDGNQASHQHQNYCYQNFLVG